MRNFRLDSQSVISPVELTEGEVIGLEANDGEFTAFKVVKLYQYREFGLYAQLDAVESSCAWSVPVSALVFVSDTITPDPFYMAADKFEYAIRNAGKPLTGFNMSKHAKVDGGWVVALNWRCGLSDQEWISNYQFAAQIAGARVMNAHKNKRLNRIVMVAHFDNK